MKMIGKVCYFPIMLSTKLKFFIGYWVVCLLFTIVYFYFHKKDLYARSEKVTATVIERLEGFRRKGRPSHYPQFQFAYNDSNYISADHNSFVSGKKKGDKLTVIFPKGQPEEAIAYTFISYWIVLPSLLIILMIFLLVFSVIIFFVYGRNILSGGPPFKRYR
jgi:hypothetical protein